MNSLDLFILIPIIAGFTFGLFRGLVKELTSLAAVVLGIYGAKFFSPWLAAVLVRSFDFSARTAQPTAYFLLFLVIVVGLLFLSRIVDKVFESMSLGGLNKLFGGLFGALKYALILSVLINVFNVADDKFSIMNPTTKSASFAYEPVLKLGPALWEEAKSYKTDKNKADEQPID